jgi:uncharacterized protein YkwD
VPRTLGHAFAFLIGFAAALWLGPARVETQQLGDPDALQLELLLYEQVNGIRAQRHLLDLTRLPELDAVAREHSIDMAKRGYIAHESPEGMNVVGRLERRSVEGFSLAAENIGTTNRPTPASEIVAAWLRSPIHRTNLLAPSFNATGIGFARGSDGSWIVTQLYATYPRD